MWRETSGGLCAVRYTRRCPDLVIVPPDSALLDPERASAPGYEFPDVDLRLSGSALVRTGSSRH